MVGETEGVEVTGVGEDVVGVWVAFLLGDADGLDDGKFEGA